MAIDDGINSREHDPRRSARTEELRDYRTAVEIAAGLSRKVRVVDNEPDSLRQDDEVQIGTGQDS
jgi:hypothetical protein